MGFQPPDPLTLLVPPGAGRNPNRRAFTLVEVMVATTILVLLLGILLSITNSIGTTVGRTSAKIDAFAGSRATFDLVGRRLSQATLNTYWDYDNPLDPTVYLRQSDLHFLVTQNSQNPGYGQELYFQSPLTYSGDPAVRTTSGLLNACAFYVQYGGSLGFRPGTESGSPERFRYRLMQAVQPTDELDIFAASPPARSDNSAWAAYWNSYWTTHAWTSSLENRGTAGLAPSVTPLIDNVIAFIVWPRLPATDDAVGADLTTDFQYDSKKNAWPTSATDKQPITANQLPPAVQVTMILVSESSAQRLNTDSPTPPKVIEDALSGRFDRVSDYQTDLKDVSDELAKNHIEFQVLNTTVALRESKWSSPAQ